jgi:hypothetical protein
LTKPLKGWFLKELQDNPQNITTMLKVSGLDAFVGAPFNDLEIYRGNERVKSAVRQYLERRRALLYVLKDFGVEL